MIQDIQGIYHDSAAGAIRVVLYNKDKSRTACLRPYLIARLSGPAVGLVEKWSYGQIDSKTTFVEGYYHVPTTGLYSLEIIVILCNTYDDNLLRQAQQYVQGGGGGKSKDAKAAFDRESEYTRQFCVESPLYHRLTANDTSILVEVASRAVGGGDSSDKRGDQGRNEGKLSPSQKIHGYWERNTSKTKTVQPLYTRYQPSECYASNDDGECVHPAAGNHRFEPYRFIWTLDEGGSRRVVDKSYLVDKVRIKSQERKNETFCLIGDSHVFYLWKDFLPTYVVNPLVRSSIYMATTFGGNFTVNDSHDNVAIAKRVKKRLEESSSGKIEHCSFILVQIAAWDAAMIDEVPTGVSLYERDMLTTIQTLQLVFPSAALFVWSPHPMALGASIWEVCPNDDWRNPPLIDAYREALQRVVAAAATVSPSNPPKYLDTSFISEPLWDFTSDWSHSGASVSDARALFIAATLLDVF
jgi:hypothetical protein